MTTKKKKHDWERYVELAAEAGSVAMSLRDRPTRLDWVALILRGVGLGFRIRAERRAHLALDPWDFFECEDLDPTWVAVPEALSKMIVPHVRNMEVLESHWDGGMDSCRVVVGKVRCDGAGSEDVGWIIDGDGRLIDGPYVRAERMEPTLRALGNSIWKRLGSRRLTFGASGLVSDPFADVAPSTQFREVSVRLERFRERGVARSFLFAGPPGTGKSTGIRYIAHALEASSLRVELSALDRVLSGQGGTTVLASVETLLRALRPQALIIDDIDRVVNESQLLLLLELANRTCEVVLASANCTDKMIGALLRPGRFDELIEVDRPDPDVVRSLVGTEANLIERLEKLPIAYVTEFVKRREVLGLKAALEELDELVERCKRAEKGG